MASVVQSFTLTADGKIHLSGQTSVTVNKGDSVQFVLVNQSGQTLLDWGLYFNNPFDITNSSRYSFGNETTIPNVYFAEKSVSQDTCDCKVAKYNAYAIYVKLEGSSGTQVIYQRDPEIIVSDGDVDR